MLKPILLSCAVLLAADVRLSTDYSAEKSYKVEFETSLSMKTTSMSMERDGEPVEGRVGFGGGGSTAVRKGTFVDTIEAASSGKATKLKRAFETLAGSNTMLRGEEETTRDLEPPLTGVTLELERAENGDVTAKVVDGTAPSDDAVLEGHTMELALDALLPDKEVADGASWELEKDAVHRVLMLDSEKMLFPRPAPPEGGEGGRGQGGGRGGRGFGGFGGGESRMLEIADWEAKATLSEESVERDGVSCRVIEVELKASGDMPEPQMGAGGGRRGQAFGAESIGAPFSNTYKIELEGKLYFSTAEKRPVAFELEGTLSQESDNEREGRDGSVMRIRSTREGTYKQTVSVSKP